MRSPSRDASLPDFVQPSRDSIWFFLGASLVIFFKLWLTWGNELIAMNMPHDQLWHIRAAEQIGNGSWLGEYDHMTLLRQPGYALWIAGIQWLEVPLRLSQEIFYLLAAVFLSWNILKIGVPGWFSIIILMLLALHPESSWMSMQALTETFYTPLLIFTLGSMIGSLRTVGSRRTYLYAAFSGIFLATMWNVRPERPLLVGILALYILLMIFARWDRVRSWKSSWVCALTCLMIQAMCIASLTISIALANRAHYGSLTTSDSLSRSFISANQALLSIRHHPSRRFVPIPRTVREEAYRISPTLRKIKDLMEGEIGQGWKSLGCENTGVCDDLSGAWFHFAFRASVAQLGYYSEAEKAEAYYRRVANEIEANCGTATLACRSPGWIDSLAYVPGDASVFLPHLFGSTKKVFTLLASSSYRMEEESKIRESPLEILQLYDRIAGRDPSNGTRNILEVRGWLAGFDDPVLNLIAVRKDGPKIESQMTWQARPDVVKFFAGQGLAVPEQNSGFLIKIFKPKDIGESDLSFVALRKNGGETMFPIKPGAFETPLRGSIDEVSENSMPKTLRDKITAAMASFFPILAAALFIAAALSLPFVLLKWRSGENNPVALSAVVLISAAVISRVLMAAVLDASSFDVARCLRILYPVMGLALIGAALILFMAMKDLGLLKGSPSLAKTPTPSK